MGNLCGGADTDLLAHTEIESQIYRDGQQRDNEVKLLLLGTGQSGKSTIVKQMKIIHLEGYSPDECEEARPIIFSNAIEAMQHLVAAIRRLGIQFESDEMTAHADMISSMIPTAEFTSGVAAAIKALWADKGIQQAFGRRSEFQLIDSASYFFTNIDRLGADDYIPTQSDVLHSRAKTTGIVEQSFTYAGLRFRMFDVGGQRNERKKWINCFANVTAVIFCVALSEYDQVLEEDEAVGRMHESLGIFGRICNSHWFVNTSIILFLNKIDLFELKVPKIDLSVCFPEYTGGSDLEAAKMYVQEQFLSLNQNPDEKQIYPYFTCATDTEAITRVFEAVKDIILQNNLRQSY